MSAAKDTIPQGLSCAGCRYDLTGLAWGTRCPECGFNIPDAWPTDALSEAHPAFLRSTRNQFGGLIIADAVILAGLLCLGAANAIIVRNQFHNYPAPRIGFLIIGGLLISAVGIILGFNFAGVMSRRHPNSRPDLDQPGRRGIAKSFWWCAGPLLIVLLLTVATGGQAACLILVALLISLPSGGILVYFLFEHATSVIKRCGHNPRWSGLQVSVVTSTGITVFALAISLISNRAMSPLLVLASLALITITHALRMRQAQRHVARVITEADQPPEPHRS